MPLAQPSITKVATTGEQPFLGKIPYAKGHDGVGFPVILDGGRKIANKLTGEMTFGEVFVNVVSLKYIGMIYLNVGEMCFISTNVRN